MRGFNGMAATVPVVVVPPQPAWQVALSGVGAAYVSLSRPLQVGIPVAGVAALAWSANEARKRDDIAFYNGYNVQGHQNKRG